MNETIATGFEAMASRCEICLEVDPQGAARDAAAATRLARLAIAEVRRIEQKYSRYRADSIVSRINAQAGAAPVACDEETLALLAYADTLFAASGGLFDITSGVLRQAWDFRRPRLPTARRLETLRALIGWQRVERDGDSVRLPQAGMELDFGGFGKEYAADRAAALLLEQGVVAGYVNLGGDLRCLGPRGDGRPWDIGIQDPRDPRRSIASIPVSRGALATSGDYERFFDLDGRRYCHILDPRSGMPVAHWRSVSVLAPLATAAGSAATIAMLLQADGADFLARSGLAWLAIDQDGTLRRQDPGAN
jgi:thiamine biosynthesis lipoprotein